MRSPRGSVRRAAEAGFTLIELMVVLVILGLLAGVVMPRLFGQGEKAKVKATRVQLRVFEDALSQYEVDNGGYPATDQGLDALVKAPPDAKHWRQGGYLQKPNIPKDPWGNPYVYFAPGRHGEDFEILSYGADGAEGGEGKYKDITTADDESEQ